MRRTQKIPVRTFSLEDRLEAGFATAQMTVEKIKKGAASFNDLMNKSPK